MTHELANIAANTSAGKLCKCPRLVLHSSSFEHQPCLMQSCPVANPRLAIGDSLHGQCVGLAINKVKDWLDRRTRVLHRVSQTFVLFLTISAGWGCARNTKKRTSLMQGSSRWSKQCATHEGVAYLKHGRKPVAACGFCTLFGTQHEWSRTALTAGGLLH
jgi:hypothetical protein